MGSLEFSCKVAGAKLILALGHTDCGAIKGACNCVELGNLTGLLEKSSPAVSMEQRHQANRTADNQDFVNDVIKLNVKKSMAEVTENSSILQKMQEDGEIIIVGGIYDVATGAVDFFR